MRYSYTIASSVTVQSYRAEVDMRWPMVLRKLTALRDRGRRSVRIVDADCGAGDLLVTAARRARELGFLAIEGRGIDADPKLIERARQAARTASDPAIGLTFETGDARLALREEAEFPADVVLYAGRANRVDDLAATARAAGSTVLRAAPPMPHRIAA